MYDVLASVNDAYAAETVGDDPLAASSGQVWTAPPRDTCSWR